MPIYRLETRHETCILNRIDRLATVLTGLLLPATALATDVTVSGLFTDKAVVQVDGGPLQTLSVGQKTKQGVQLVAVDRESATFDIDGQRVTLGLGSARMAATAPVLESVAITADVRGHFTADGQVNGMPVRFMVDTGASLVSLPASEAQRLSLDYRKGQKALMGTANGTVPGYLITLDTLKVGGVTLHGIDAVVLDGPGFGSPLLGMSALNRLNMKREGDVMTLTRRY